MSAAIPWSPGAVNNSRLWQARAYSEGNVQVVFCGTQHDLLTGLLGAGFEKLKLTCCNQT